MSTTVEVTDRPMDAAAATTASPGALTRDEVTTDPAGAGNLTSAEALAAATSLFADTFHRWSSRMAVEAGANLTRLRLLHLVRCHGPLKMADLAGSLAVTPRSVTALVDGLEALAAATSLFADTFHRWSSRMAVEAGANLTRLRLLHLVRCHGPLKMADLAGSLAVTPRSVTALVDGLEAEELVRRIPHSTDRRVTLVELTCNRDLVQARMSAYQSSLESLFADMPEDDRVTLRRLLVNLRDRMDAGAAPRPRSQDGRDA